MRSDRPTQRAPGASSTGGRRATADAWMAFVVPVYREGRNLPAMLARLTDALDALPAHEAAVDVVLVDDASTDDSWDQLAAFAAARPGTRAVRFARNFGESAALFAGFAHVAEHVPIVVTMEAHAEHRIEDAFEIARRLRDGAPGDPGPLDVVSGMRLGRRDPWWRLAGSVAVNRALDALDANPFQDLGFLLKAWRRDYGLGVFAQAHGRIEHGRFVRALQGARAADVPVQCHYPNSEPSSYRLPELTRAAWVVLRAAAVDRFGLPRLDGTLPNPAYVVADVVDGPARTGHANAAPC